VPLFSQPQNVYRIDYSALPKSSWHAHLKEHKGVPGDIAVHPGDENLELGYPPRVSCMSGLNLDRSYREVDDPKYRSQKS